MAGVFPVFIVAWAVVQILREAQRQRDAQRSLLESAESGDGHGVRSMLHGASEEQATEALRASVRRCQDNSFIAIWESGLADPTTTEGDGYNLLHLAAIGLGDASTARGALRIFRRIVDSGIIPLNSSTADGATALALAASAGHAEAVNLLLATHGVEVDVADSRGRTPLTRAADALALPVVRALLAGVGGGRADPNHRDAKGNTPLILAAGSASNAPARRGVAVEVLRALVASGARLDEANAAGTTALAAACARGNAPAAAALIASGASVQLVRRQPMALPRRRTCAGGPPAAHAPLARLLRPRRGRGRPGDGRSDPGRGGRPRRPPHRRRPHVRQPLPRPAHGRARRPLHLAARAGRRALCAALLDLGADPCAADYSRERRTPAAWALDDETRAVIESRRDALFRFSDGPQAERPAEAGPSTQPPRAPRQDEDDEFVLVDVQRPPRPACALSLPSPFFRRAGSRPEQGSALIAAVLASVAAPSAPPLLPPEPSAPPPGPPLSPSPYESEEANESPERRAMREELTCPICWSLYRDPLSVPVRRPVDPAPADGVQGCGHAFCAEHLDDIIANGPSRLASLFRLIVRCPLCRHEASSPEVYPNVQLRTRVREFLAGGPDAVRL